jgi:hypothetical protein
MRRVWLTAFGLVTSLAVIGWAQAPLPAAPKGHPPAALPKGHPPAALPKGHPPAALPKAGRSPHGAGGQAKLQPDRVQLDPLLAPGSVLVTIVDAAGQPIAKAPIILAILENTVEKGESKSQRSATANERGRHRFDGLKTGTGISYRVTTIRGSGSFASQPFGLKDKQGMRVLLHVYPPTDKLADTLFVIEAFIVLDVKQDTVAVNHMLRTLNFGRNAYTPKGVTMKLPPGARAFSGKDNMNGIGVVESKDGTAELVGTFPPGQAEITYRYSLPLRGGSTLALDLPLPPRVVQATVMVGAGPGMTLKIAGFPAATPARRRDGQRVLKTNRQPDMSRGVRGVLDKTSPEILSVMVTGLPTPGPGRWIALALAIAAAVGGVVGLRRDQKRAADGNANLSDERREDLSEARDALLDEFVVLERARHDGEVGPRSYERLRGALLDALARVVSQLEDAVTPQAHTGQQAKSPRAKPA